MPLDSLLRALWARKGAVMLAALVLFAAGAATVLAMPRRFVATATVAPAETANIATSFLLSPSPLLQGGLLDTRPTGNFSVYLGVLRSAEAVEMLMRETPVLAQLAAARGQGLAGALRALLGADRLPNADDVADWLRRNLAVTAGLQTVSWTLELAHADRAAALDMLARLHRFAEERVRADLTTMAERRLAVLADRLARETDVYQRQAMYDLFAQQQRIALVLAADQAVAARIVSAPSVDVLPSRPDRALLIGLLAPASLLAALVLAACAVLLRAPAPRRAFGYGDD
jgi:hypothetical protein